MIINDIGMTLREFLGLPPYEYQKWGKNSDEKMLTIKEKYDSIISTEGELYYMSINPTVIFVYHSIESILYDVSLSAFDV